jgi:rod shape determining protein RodA
MSFFRFAHRFFGGNEIAIIAALTLQTIGILALSSATHTVDSGGQVSSLVLRQAMFFGVGVVLCVAAIAIPVRILQAFSYLIFVMSVLSLGSVLVLGRVGMGAERWLAFGPVRFQPSEFAKVALILALARLLTERSQEWNRVRTLILATALTVLCMGLVLVEPDFGTSMVYPVLLFIMLFWAGLSPITLLIMASPIAVIPAGFHWVSLAIVLTVIAIVLYLSRTRFLIALSVLAVLMGIGLATPNLWSHLHPYQQRRIQSFLNPNADPMGSAYQLIQSKVTVGSGGFAGKGFLKGTQTHLKFLPEQHTDFIFSVWGEEFGFLGSVIVLAAFLVLIVRSFLLSTKVRNAFLGAMCAGIAAFFLIHAFVNIGMTLGMLPVTGLPLPFMSYGGSMLVSSWLLVGLMTSAARQWREY